MFKSITKDLFTPFFKSGQAGGILLLLMLLISLTIANTSLSDHFSDILTIPIGSGRLRYPLLTWINDGLMAIFFLLVGLEIKREILEGELSSFRNAALPVFAAVGGMICPALFYTIFNTGTTTSGGWGIPMATDIAFALAIISLLGKRVPPGLKIFLAALAIVDDLGAILVIAFFYTDQIHLIYLVMAAVTVLLLISLNYFGVKKLIFYLIPGLFLWYFLHHSGIHATIAGVCLAMTIPSNKSLILSPLDKLEHSLHIPVHYFIMPLFALANTNITIYPEMVSGLTSSLGLGILSGLFVGKTLGISFFSWLAVKLKWAKRPNGTGWKHLLGVGMLGGIGFTMSIFISILSFDDPSLIAEAKFAILIASVISGLAGYTFLKGLNNKKPVPEGSITQQEPAATEN